MPSNRARPGMRPSHDFRRAQHLLAATEEGSPRVALDPAIVEGWRRWAVRGLQITDVCHILRRAGSAAEQAGFSEHGKNRLVMPAFAADRDPSREQGKQDDDGSGAGGGGGKDPLIAALIQKLPDTGTDWSADDRVMWLQMIAMAFQMAYGQKEAIKITKEAAH
jgi:hypothetical protein